MIRILQDIKGSKINATDGDIGSVVDCYFDEDKWAVRYLIVDTGNWLPGRRVLISPISVKAGDWGNNRIQLNLSQERVRNSPDIDVARPVSRNREIEYYQYYGWPYYWQGVGIWGVGATPGALGTTVPPSSSLGGGPHPAPGEEDARRAAETRVEYGVEESRIRSAVEVGGYHIQARDQEIGHIEDFVVNENDWSIESVLIDTSNWPGGKTVVVQRNQISRVEWASRRVFVNLSSEEIKNSPEFSTSSLTRR
jgi:sporulation protein YlmC with PRC-barrel domain